MECAQFRDATLKRTHVQLKTFLQKPKKLFIFCSERSLKFKCLILLSVTEELALKNNTYNFFPLSDTQLLYELTAQTGRAAEKFLVLSHGYKDQVLCKTDDIHHICSNQPKMKAHEIYIIAMIYKLKLNLCIIFSLFA